MVIPLILVAIIGGGFVSLQATPVHKSVKIETTNSSSVPSDYNFFNYSPKAAISYAMMVHSKYFGEKYYPSGLNFSLLQKNLDYFGSEDCAHFISEILIAAGLTELSINAPLGPGDNLTSYDNGAFVGSYGIVGVYRLVSYLLGYVPSVFSTNANVEAKLGYQPIPASFQGSPLATPYYVLNESMLPSYFLSPGDIIADGGVGSGHIMFYLGNGMVVQTDPAEKWIYEPGVDSNISLYGFDTLSGRNVSAIYIHIPRFNGPKTVNITVLANGISVSNGTVLKTSDSVYLIGSFPDGVGLGNYSYTWLDNGKVISSQQNFTFKPQNGVNNVRLASTGSNGTAYQNFTFYYGSKSANRPSLFPIEVAIIILIIVAVSATFGVIFFVSRRRRNQNK